MGLKVRFDNEENISPSWSDPKAIQKHWKTFLQTIEKEDIGFFHVNRRSELISTCFEIYEKFQSRKNFIQVGIGGSSLGPEMLVSALGKSDRRFEFLNNIDPDKLKRQLNGLKPAETLFYFVSKSGGTAETMATLAIVCSWLKENGIETTNFSNHMVFATDPVKSDLLELGKDWGVSLLEIPSNVGGRFSVLTPVGYLPALFAGLNIRDLASGAEEIKKEILSTNLSENILIKSANYLMSLRDIGFTQTVLMPYSSLLKDFSSWFVQLWAESLGKKVDMQGNEVNTGFTPIASYGATDQHSQVQLFIEGPKDKVLIFLELESFGHDYPLVNDIPAPSLKKLAPFSLGQLMQAELQGTKKALEVADKPYMSLILPELNEKYLGQVILYFEALTALTGIMLNINPFDQPGVEHGKRYAFEWLQEL